MNNAQSEGSIKDAAGKAVGLLALSAQTGCRTSSVRLLDDDLVR